MNTLNYFYNTTILQFYSHQWILQIAKYVV